MNRPLGCTYANGYIVVQFLQEFYGAHVLAWVIVKGRWPKREVDHRDTIKTNNKWKNLRSATRSQNRQNIAMYKSNKSGFKRVTRAKPGTNRWRAHIQINKKQYSLGTFDSPELAGAAYAKAAKKYFGEFARTA
jgi:hypothetical protein